MADIERAWSFKSVDGAKLEKHEARRVLADRFTFGSRDMWGVATDLVNIIPSELWTEEALSTMDLTPFLRALGDATADGGAVGTVNGVTVGTSNVVGGVADSGAYRKALSELSGQMVDELGLTANLQTMVPGIKDKDLTAALTDILMYAGERSTIGPVDSHALIREALAESDLQLTTTTTTVDAQGQRTTTESKTPWEQALDGVETTVKTRKLLSIEQLRRMASKGELDFRTLEDEAGRRQAMLEGGEFGGETFDPSKTTYEVGPEAGVYFEAGGPATMAGRDYTGGAFISLRESQRFLDGFSEAQIKNVQDNLVQAGLLTPGTFTKGSKDKATRSAWEEAIYSSFAADEALIPYLRNEARLVREAELTARASARLPMNESKFDYMLDGLGQQVIGRKLSPMEKAQLRMQVLALDRQQGEVVNGEFRTGFTSEEDIKAEVGDMLREMRPGDAETRDRFFQMRETARLNGRPLRLPSMTDEQIAGWATVAGELQFDQDALFMHMYMDGPDGYKAFEGMGLEGYGQAKFQPAILSGTRVYQPMQTIDPVKNPTQPNRSY